MLLFAGHNTELLFFYFLGDTCHHQIDNSFDMFVITFNNNDALLVLIDQLQLSYVTSENEPELPKK